MYVSDWLAPRHSGASFCAPLVDSAPGSVANVGATAIAAMEPAGRTGRRGWRVSHSFSKNPTISISSSSVVWFAAAISR